MANDFGRAIKDGLKAIGAWVVLTVILVLLFHYPGWIIAQFIGLIFVVCFIALWGARILFAILKPFTVGGGGAPPRQQPPAAGPGGQPQAASRTCSTCGGSGRMTCPSCRGQRGRYDMPTTAQGTSQWVPCSYCVGNGSTQCTSCSGAGQFNY